MRTPNRFYEKVVALSIRVTYTDCLGYKFKASINTSSYNIVVVGFIVWLAQYLGEARYLEDLEAQADAAIESWSKI